MQKYFLTILFFFACSRVKAEKDLIIKIPNDYLHYRIGLESQVLLKEMPSGSWGSQGKLTFSNIDLRDFKILHNQSFERHGFILISIEGTGQVYGLDIKNLELSRIDSTYFRGHNFSAIKFIRKDTLFSYGGSGFWHVNNIETYFSPKTKEWELLNVPVEKRPEHMTNAYGGYDSRRDIVSVIDSPPSYCKSIQDFTYHYYEKDIKANEWKKLGAVNAQLLFKLGAKSLKSVYLNGIFLFLESDYILLADPIKNKILLVEKSIPLFSNLYELEARNGFLYSYHRENHFKETRIKVDSISIEKLKSMGIPKGEFYVNVSNDMLLISIIILVVANVLIFYFFTRKKRKRNKYIISDLAEAQWEEALPNGAYEFLKSFLAFPKGQEINSHKIIDLMGFGSYAYETQRQVRSKLISAINSYFKVHHHMDAVILRKNSKNDKRFFVYTISEEYYDALKKMLLTNE